MRLGYATEFSSDKLGIFGYATEFESVVFYYDFSYIIPSSAYLKYTRIHLKYSPCLTPRNQHRQSKMNQTFPS